MGICRCEECGAEYDPNEVLNEIRMMEDPSEDCPYAEIYEYNTGDFEGLCSNCAMESIGTDYNAGVSYMNGD